MFRSRRRQQPRFPFWRLQSDGLWEVVGPDGLQEVGRSGDPLDNALALCSLHHRAFDRGVLSLDDDHRIMVSRLFRGGARARALIVELHERPLGHPQPGVAMPASAHIGWHQREVFKGPERLVTLAAEEPPR